VHSVGEAFGALLLPPYGLYLAVESEFAHRAGPLRPMPGEIDMDAATAACIAEAEFFADSGLTREQYAIWCRCSAQMIADGFTQAEAEYVRENGANSPQFARVIGRARQSCYATSRYLGGGAATED
jgi:hypothetical protein